MDAENRSLKRGWVEERGRTDHVREVCTTMWPDTVSGDGTCVGDGSRVCHTNPRRVKRRVGIP